MASAPDKLVALRELLARRFPQATPLSRSRCLPVGVPVIDEATGGLPIGAITEVVCATPSCGGMLLLAQTLAVCRAQRLRVALIDACDRFDPQSFAPDALAHLVWVRCRDLRQAMQTVDLIARDANFGLIILDIRSAAERDLRKEPPTSWYRLQRAVEQTDLPLLVETARALVPSAQVRFVLERAHVVDSLEQPQPELTTSLAPKLQRVRQAAAQ